MNHLPCAKERSEVKKLLLIEEVLAERVISLIRVAGAGLLLAWAVIQALARREEALRTILPIGIIAALSVFLLGYSLIAVKRTLRTGRAAEALKYIHITADLALIAWFAHTGLPSLARFAPSLAAVDLALLYTGFYCAAAAVYLFVNLFRFHLYASLYAGVLLLGLFAVVAFFSPVLSPLLRRPELFGRNLFFILAFLASLGLDLCLAAFFAGRMRRFLARHKAQERLARFLPGSIDRELLERGQEIPDSGVRARATVLCADIHDFAAFTAALGPAETVALLNSCFNDLSDAIFRYEGALNKTTGHGLTAVFGAPLKSLEPEANAVRAAIDICRRLESLNTVRAHAKLPPLAVGIGVHSGEVLLGNVGSDRRLDFTALGDTVDIACRIEQFSRPVATRIIVSETTRARLGGEFSVTVLGKTTLKGQAQPLRLYAVNPWLTPVNVTEA